MKYELPEKHGLSEKCIRTLVFKENNSVSLTDAQYSALEAGVGRGESALIVAPTSTGKTQIALWAIAGSIEKFCTTVYLVTHRALARQKFDDFRYSIVDGFLGGDLSSLVIATGDYVMDAASGFPAEPLTAPVLVATYEKYLALLSASGVPDNMDSTVVICDEIQLIGDEHRGQHVEVLLTLLRNAGWKQFLGLSAVLDLRDARKLADWLNVELVVEHAREKQLVYECWTNTGIISASTSYPDQINASTPNPHGVNLDPLSVLFYLINTKNPPQPIIVFCMTKQDTYDLAEEFVNKFLNISKGQMSLAFDELPETSANEFLSGIIDHGVAVHNADLMDEERIIIEKRLTQNKLNIIFATSTLAAGVNFPLGAAIFSTWKRWDSTRKINVPINSGEFHNMAGRTGRMGYEHEAGRVIFFAESYSDVQTCHRYLALDALPTITPRVSEKQFKRLSLQLISSGLCSTRSSVIDLVCSTFSGLQEEDNNFSAYKKWPSHLDNIVTSLCSSSLLIESNSGLSATPIGKAIGNSGLLPETGIFLLNYVVQKIEVLVDCLPGDNSLGSPEKLAFLIFSSCFSSPEFRPSPGLTPSRFLPWPLGRGTLFDASIYAKDLAESTWYADIFPINAAKLACDWIDGAPLRNLESALPNLSAGMLREIFRNLVWVMQGLSSILIAASDSRVPLQCRPECLRLPDDRLSLLRKLPRTFERLSLRVAEGLPDKVLWLNSISSPDNNFRINRHEIISLFEQGYTSPEQLIQGAPEADRVRLKAFAKVKPTPHAKANWFRDACRDWKTNQRVVAATKQIERATRLGLERVFRDYHSNIGEKFERAFENLLDQLGISYVKIDSREKIGAPDYAVTFIGCPTIVVELKSKQNNGLVDYNKAVEVISAAEIHGYKNCFCLTVCHPGVDPSVPSVIISSGRLCVVESHDLGEALLRMAQKSLSQGQLWEWLSTPGQALVSDLSYKDYTL